MPFYREFHCLGIGQFIFRVTDDFVNKHLFLVTMRKKPFISVRTKEPIGFNQMILRGNGPGIANLLSMTVFNHS